MNQVADAIRKVTAKMQAALDAGQRSRQIDAEDLIDVLLAIADQLDLPFGGQPPKTTYARSYDETLSPQSVSRRRFIVGLPP